MATHQKTKSSTHQLDGIQRQASAHTHKPAARAEPESARPPSVRHPAQFDDGVWSKQLFLIPLQRQRTDISLRRLARLATLTSWWTYVLILVLTGIYVRYGTHTHAIHNWHSHITTNQISSHTHKPLAWIIIGVAVVLFIGLLVLRGLIRHKQYSESVKMLDSRPVNQSSPTRSYGKSLFKRGLAHLLILIVWLVFLAGATWLVILSGKRFETDLRGTSSLILYAGILVFITSSLFLLAWHRLEVILVSISSANPAQSLGLSFKLAIRNIVGLFGASLWGSIITSVFLLWISAIGAGLYFGLNHMSGRFAIWIHLSLFIISIVLLLIGIWYQQMWSKNYWARLYNLLAHRSHQVGDYLG